MAGIGLGLGAIGNAFLEGQQQAEDLKFQKQQRQRLVDEQGRQDQLRKDLQGVQQTEQVQEPDMSAPQTEQPVQDGEVGPNPAAPQPTVTATRQRPQDAVLRDYANAYAKQGDIAKSADLTSQADKLAWQRSSRMAQGVIASSSGDNVSLYDMAQNAGKVFHNDPFGGGVKSVTQNPDGSVNMTIYNKDDGFAGTLNFTNKKQLAETLQSHYAPDSFQKLVERRQQIEDEIAKNPYQAVNPGATLIDKRTNKPVYVNPNDRAVTGYDENGNPIYGKPMGGSGAGAGAGVGKAGKGGALDPVAAALSHFDSATKDADDKLTIDQRASARDNVSKLATNNPNLPPAMASRIGIDIAKNPTKLAPAINPDTGLIDEVYDDGNNGKIAFNTGIGSAIKPGNLKPEQLQQMTKTLMDSKTKAERDQLVAAANDPKARAAMESDMRKKADDVIAQATQGMSPQQAQIVADRVNQGLDTKLQYLGNNLNMIKSYYPQPNSGGQGGSSVVSRLAGAGGLGTKKYDGMSGRELGAAVDRDSQAMIDANRGQAAKMDAARKQAAQDPEILQLEQERSKLLKNGDAYGANAKIAQANKIRKERYGL